MLTTVLILNSALALLCLFAAWQMIRLRRYLSKVADTLIAAERSTHKVLHKAPEFIMQGKTGTQQFRQQHQQLQLQLQQLRQIVAIANMGWAFWLQRSVATKSAKRSRSRLF